eukprot:7686045-Heterocapsa_arctica.AAC.1
MSVYIGKLEGQKDLWDHTLKSCGRITTFRFRRRNYAYAARLKFIRERSRSQHITSGTAQMEENFTLKDVKILEKKEPARVEQQECASVENMQM